MYRIILVDDEQQIRKGLSNLIAWDELGIEICGEASDGVSALEVIRQLQPHIVIADIQMPNMNGLQLLEEASKLPNPPKFIMLSGFDQFDFVRTSMRLGACNYLLKPVNVDELKLTLQETIELLEETAAQKQQFEESTAALLNNTLNRILNSRIDVRELREKCQLLGITLRCNHMLVGLLKPEFNHADPTLRYIVFDSLKICQDVFSPHLTVYGVADSFDNIALIIKNPDQLIKTETLTEYLSICAEEITQRLNVPCEYALGYSASSFREIPASYQCALQMLDIKKIWQEKPPAPAALSAVQQVVANTFDTERLQSLLFQNDLEQIRQTVANFFEQVLPANQVLDADTAKYHAIELITCFLQAAQQNSTPIKDLQNIKSGFYETVRTINSMQSLQEYISQFIQHLCNHVQQLDTVEYSQNVNLAVRYVRQHYGNCNLSLKTMAGMLNVNSAYLGRQFSLETGAFFSDYLNNIRIQHARQLLNTTSLKISEIAVQVGFSNVSYFNTIYKKITGERPKSTRSQST